MVPGLARGHDGRVGVPTSGITGLNGDQVSHIVPAVFPLTTPYPVGADGSTATPVTATSGNVAAAVATATIPAVAGKTAYISGFDINGGGATAALIVNPTVTGVISGTKTYTYGAALGATIINTPLSVIFNPPIPASAVNTAIAVNCPSLGAGNTNNTVNAYGFYI